MGGDGASVLTASWDNTAKLWSIETGACTHTFAGHTDYVQSAVFSGDGASVLTASCDNTAKLWSIETGACTQTLAGHIGRLESAVFSPAGVVIVESARRIGHQRNYMDSNLPAPRMVMFRLPES